MPYVPCDSETSRSITSLGHISTNALCKSVVFEESDSLGEKAGTDEEEDSSGTDEEPVKGGAGTGLVDQVAYIHSAMLGSRVWLDDIPTIDPAMSPTITAIGMETAGIPSDT